MRKITILTAVFALLAFLAIPMGMWGQATTYTSNVTLPLSGTNVSSCKVIISGTQYDGTKLGKSNTGASANVTIPAGTTTLYVHCAAWNGKSSKLALSTTASGVSITPNGDWTLTSDSGIANNSPFTLASPDKASTDYFREYTLTGVTSDISVKFEAKNERAVFWGVNAVAGSTPSVATPTFSPVGGTFTEAQTVSISCETTGTTIYYTLDGTDPDDESTQYTSPITVSETKTIKAIAIDGNDNTSAIATATYTIVTPMTIAEVRAQQTGNVATTGTVTSCVGTTGYIQDATAAICVYGATLTVGDNILILGTLSDYNGLLEITNPQVTVISSGNTVNPELMTIAQIVASTNQGWYIRIEEATVTAISGSGNQQNTTIAQGANTVVVRGNLGTTVAVDDIISLNGNIGYFNVVQIANPQNVTVHENENPFISAENISIAWNATSGEIEYTINNPVTGGVLSATTNDPWLTLGEVGTTVPFTCTANSEITVRTATVTLTYAYNRATVTKDVTITQAAYEAPHYTWDLSIASYDEIIDTDIVTWSSNYATMTNSSKSGGTSASNYLGGDANNRTSSRFYANNTLTISPVAGYAIDSVVFTATSTNYATAFAGSTWTNATAVANGTIVTVTPTDGAVDIVAVIGGTCGFTAVTVYYEENNNPSITANNVEIAYDATSGSIAYTINNQVTGGVLTAATTAEWITLGTVGATVPFTCTVNAEAVFRTATVTLTYTYNRATVTKNVTVTQAGNPGVTMTIAEVREQGTGDVATIGTVTSFSVNNSNKTTAYIQDATAAIVVFGEFNVAVGDEISVSGTLSTYHGLLEITNPVVTVLSSGNTVNPELMTIAEINADDYTSNNSIQGLYVTIENAKVTGISGSNTTIAQGDNTIVVRGISSDVTYAVNDTLTLNGNIGCYDGAQIAHPTDVIVQSNQEPAITVTPTRVDVPCAAAEGTLTVTYQNIETELGAEIYWYEADGETPATYDWVSANFDTVNNVAYTISANTGEARLAYMKVYGIGTDESDVYSELITFSQGHYIPDFATLPFDFDGGRADIANTYGLTQNGLGGDYGSSPKLRFDDTGDWMILHFNEEPGQLIYSIKGNTFSNGTFTVQTSADGETYTDLAVYTDLGSTVDTVEFDLGANVRYIKWIYTEKGNGNVALGNIQVKLPSTAPVITVTPALVELDADATDDVLEVTYQNITTIVADVYFCDAEGQLAQYNWITATIDEDNNVYYVIEENTGAARTAYLKVKVGEVYSNLVTITQAAFVPPFTPVTYTLATSIESGRHYIIIGLDGENAYAMGAQTNNNRAAVPITIVDGEAQVDTDGVYEVVINGPDANRFYTIYEARNPGYLYAASSTSNHLRTRQFNTNANSQWTITFGEENNAVIMAQGDHEHNLMRFNTSNNGLFSCYTGGQKNVYLYVKNEEEPQYDFYKDVLGYGENEDDYRLIATPTTDNADPGQVGLIVENGFDLYGFDFRATDEEWQNYNAGAEVYETGLALGKGYLYASQSDVTLHFQGTPNIAIDQEIALQYENNANCWNLIGNPLSVAAGVMEGDFYVMNAGGNEIVLSETDVISPMEAIFVKATQEGQTITFYDYDNSGGFTGEEGGDDWKLNLSVNGSNGSNDFARIRFGEGQNLEKLMLNESHTKLYFPVNGSKYAVVYASNEGEMPVNFKPEANGTYTLSIDAEHVEMQYLHLIDNLTGEDIDLLANPSYKFEASVYDNAARFTLVVRK